LASNRNAPAFRRFSVDVKVQAGLGRFYAWKFRAGVLYALYERTGERAALDAAVRAYRSARQAWAGVIAVTKGVYAADVTFGNGWFQRGNWADRIAAIDLDIAAMEKKAGAPPPSTATDVPHGRISALIASALDRPNRRSTEGLVHVPARSFLRGKALPLEVAIAAETKGWTGMQLYYRHTHQADPWHAAAMSGEAGKYRAAIPGEFTDRYFPLQYYFELSDDTGGKSLFPHLGPDLTQQPYFVVRPA